MKCSEKTDQVAAALANVQAKAAVVGKSGKNTFDNYTYAMLVDYVVTLAPLLEEEGLSVVADVTDVKVIDGRQTAKGQAQNTVLMEVELTAFHKSGQWISVTTVGEGMDRGDKAAYKAQTGARKYGLASLFNVATSDDPEKHTPHGSGDSKPPRAQDNNQPVGEPTDDDPTGGLL